MNPARLPLKSGLVCRPTSADRPLQAARCSADRSADCALHENNTFCALLGSADRRNKCQNLQRGQEWNFWSVCDRKSWTERYGFPIFSGDSPIRCLPFAPAIVRGRSHPLQIRARTRVGIRGHFRKHDSKLLKFAIAPRSK